MKGVSESGRKPLSFEEKLKVVQSGTRVLRDLGDEFNVHHSTINSVQQEAADVLRNHWEEKSKRVGRPRKKVDDGSGNVEQLESKIAAIEKQLAMKEMRIDWLELKLKWSEEALNEAKVRKQKQLKKKRKKK